MEVVSRNYRYLPFSTRCEGHLYLRLNQWYLAQTALRNPRLYNHCSVPSRAVVKGARTCQRVRLSGMAELSQPKPISSLRSKTSVLISFPSTPPHYRRPRKYSLNSTEQHLLARSPANSSYFTPIFYAIRAPQRSHQSFIPRIRPR